MFYEKLSEREKQSGWMEAGENIIMIPDSTRTPRNLITEYGRLVVENIEANIQNFIGKISRQAYNSVQIFHYLTNSMIESAHLKIVAESNNYMDDETQVGELLFKSMMQKAVIETIETTTHLR